ncbi:hypothetical protein D3C77_601710 [compost metagenome]
MQANVAGDPLAFLIQLAHVQLRTGYGRPVFIQRATQRGHEQLHDFVNLRELILQLFERGAGYQSAKRLFWHAGLHNETSLPD